MPSQSAESLPSIHEVFPEHFAPGARARDHSHLGTGSRGRSLTDPGQFALRRQAPDLGAVHPEHRVRPWSPIVNHGDSGKPREAQLVHLYGTAMRHPPHTAPFPSGLAHHAVNDPAFPGISQTSTRNEKRHICSYCPRRFNRPSSLAIHINTHTGARPFICPKCGRRFSVNSNMRRHYRNHGTAPESLDRYPGSSTPPSSGVISYEHHTPSWGPIPIPAETDHSQSESEYDEPQSGYTLAKGREYDLEKSLGQFSLDPHSLYAMSRTVSYRGAGRPRSISDSVCTSDQISTTLRPAIYSSSQRV